MINTARLSFGTGETSFLEGQQDAADLFDDRPLQPDLGWKCDSRVVPIYAAKNWRPRCVTSPAVNTAKQTGPAAAPESREFLGFWRYVDKRGRLYFKGKEYGADKGANIWLEKGLPVEPDEMRAGGREVSPEILAAIRLAGRNR